MEENRFNTKVVGTTGTGSDLYCVSRKNKGLEICTDIQKIDPGKKET